MTLRFFCLGQLAGGANHLDARRVDAVRLLDKHVFAGLHCGHQVERMELGGVGDQDHVGRLDHVLVAVEAREAVVVVHLDLLRVLLLEQFPLFLDAVEQHVGHGHQAHALGRRSSPGPRLRCSARRSRSSRRE